MSETELLPCPGCGRTDQLGIEGHDFGERGTGEYAVACKHCGWRGPRSYRVEAVVERWNRRVPLTAALSAETEACAKVAETMFRHDPSIAVTADIMGEKIRHATENAGFEIAAAIRQRQGERS